MVEQGSTHRMVSPIVRFPISENQDTSWARNMLGTPGAGQLVVLSCPTATERVALDVPDFTGATRWMAGASSNPYTESLLLAFPAGALLLEDLVDVAATSCDSAGTRPGECCADEHRREPADEDLAACWISACSILIRLPPTVDE